MKDEALGPWAQAIGLALRAMAALVLLATLAWPFSNLRQVGPDKRAVVLRLGRVVRVEGAGLLLAWPAPLERLVFLPSAERQVEFSFAPLLGSADGGSDWTIEDDIRQDAAFFMTADGVVHLTASLFYRIDEPASYVLEAAHVPAALRAMTMASLVSLTAARDTDTLVVTREDALSDADRSRRERLRADLARAINRRLGDLREQGAGLGIEVTRVDLGTALPGVVRTAFEGVLVAAQQADTAVAQARSEAIGVAQDAQSRSGKLLADANAAAAERVSLASRRTAPIDALSHRSNGVSGGELMDRIYYERIETILHDAKSVEAFDPDTGARLVLPGRSP